VNQIDTGVTLADLARFVAADEVNGGPGKNREGRQQPVDHAAVPVDGDEGRRQVEPKRAAGAENDDPVLGRIARHSGRGLGSIHRYSLSSAGRGLISLSDLPALTGPG